MHLNIFVSLLIFIILVFSRGNSASAESYDICTKMEHEGIVFAEGGFPKTVVFEKTVEVNVGKEIFKIRFGYFQPRYFDLYNEDSYVIEKVSTVQLALYWPNLRYLPHNLNAFSFLTCILEYEETIPQYAMRLIVYDYDNYMKNSEGPRVLSDRAIARYESKISYDHYMVIEEYDDGNFIITGECRDNICNRNVFTGNYEIGYDSYTECILGSESAISHNCDTYVELHNQKLTFKLTYTYNARVHISEIIGDTLAFIEESKYPQ